MCGNHCLSRCRSQLRAGSPPRVREPQTDGTVQLNATGITPACAGTTSARSQTRSATWDHPRVCGNHSVQSSRASSMLGSPPRVREPLRTGRADDIAGGITPACAGTTTSSHSAAANIRITPACAGTTHLRRIRHLRARDHPRVCGNHKETAA